MTTENSSNALTRLNELIQKRFKNIKGQSLIDWSIIEASSRMFIATLVVPLLDYAKTGLPNSSKCQAKKSAASLALCDEELHRRLATDNYQPPASSVLIKLAPPLDLKHPDDTPSGPAGLSQATPLYETLPVATKAAPTASCLSNIKPSVKSGAPSFCTPLVFKSPDAHLLPTPTFIEQTSPSLLDKSSCPLTGVMANTTSSAATPSGGGTPRDDKKTRRLLDFVCKSVGVPPATSCRTALLHYIQKKWRTTRSAVTVTVQQVVPTGSSGTKTSANAYKAHLTLHLKASNSRAIQEGIEEPVVREFESFEAKTAIDAREQVSEQALRFLIERVKKKPVTLTTALSSSGEQSRHPTVADLKACPAPSKTTGAELSLPNNNTTANANTDNNLGLSISTLTRYLQQHLRPGLEIPWEWLSDVRQGDTPHRSRFRMRLTTTDGISSDYVEMVGPWAKSKRDAKQLTANQVLRALRSGQWVIGSGGIVLSHNSKNSVLCYEEQPVLVKNDEPQTDAQALVGGVHKRKLGESMIDTSNGKSQRFHDSMQ